MEVDTPLDGHMAPVTISSSIKIALHPLVVLTISEHWTRSRIQHNLGSVMGALLGKQSGREIEICNCFELCPFFNSPESEPAMELNVEFFHSRLAQYKEVYADLTFVGWYSCDERSEGVFDDDVVLHKQFCDIIMSDSPLMPVLLMLKPGETSSSDSLPIHLYESVLEVMQGSPRFLFIPLTYSLAAAEAERIGVDHVARDTSAGGSRVSDTLLVQKNSILALLSRIQLLVSYVRSVVNGELPVNQSLLREVRALVDQLPVANDVMFSRGFHCQCNDVQLVALLGSMVQATNRLNQLIGKAAIVMDRRMGGVAVGRGRAIQSFFS